MRERNIRSALIVVELFAAVSAFAGALGLLVGFMNIPLSVLHGSPFADFTVPALLLGIVVGGSALAAATMVVVEPRLGIWPRQIGRVVRLGTEGMRIGPLASAIAGCIMVGWMTIEIALIGLGSWLQPAYLAVGLMMIGLASLLQWRASQEIRVSDHQLAA